METYEVSDLPTNERKTVIIVLIRLINVTDGEMCATYTY